MRSVQFRAQDGSRGVAVVGDDAQGKVVHGVSTTFALASRAIAEKLSLDAMTERLGLAKASTSAPLWRRDGCLRRWIIPIRRICW